MIPKTIHYCWFGRNPKPKSVEKCIKSWKKYCPDYQIIEWNESNYDISKNKYMEQAYQAGKWGFVPDYARLDIILNHGGIYLDTDVQVIRSLDELLAYDAYFGMEQAGAGVNINLGHGFGAIPGHPIVRTLCESYRDWSFLKEDGSFDLTPSPRLNTPVIQHFGFLPVNKTQKKGRCVVFSSEAFAPKNFRTGLTNITPQTYSVHHYDASWYDDSQQANKQLRWKKYRRLRARSRREHLKEIIFHLPHMAAKKVLGEKKYRKLKGRVKHSSE